MTSSIGVRSSTFLYLGRTRPSHRACGQGVHVLVVLHERVEDEKNAVPRVDLVCGQAGVNLIDELRPFQRKVILDHRPCSRDQLASERERNSVRVRDAAYLNGSFV
jgi:hypothetical protein